MMNKNERMNKLNAMGINTGKYFTVNLPDGLAKNSTITLSINEDGEYTVVNANDVIANQIIEDGYVRNTKLHRRFVMAQMFQGLNYKSWYYSGKEGYNEWLKNHGLKYSFKMMLEEIRVLGKLEMRDEESFVERSHFFTNDVIVATMSDYIGKLQAHIDAQRTYKCKGVPYKKVKGIDIFVADLEKKIYAPMRRDVRKVLIARNYNEIYKIVSEEVSKYEYGKKKNT